jgi:ATP/maltotriose-dependent transcriptional regulator MalT/two-component SAPR family response regulator
MNLFDQVTRTKILLPRRRPDLLSRQRLLDLLSDLLEYKLIIVAAPAGYGKTSLLVDIAHQSELPTCWYALDSLDRDPQRFITHFIAAIARHFPRFGPRSWITLQNGIVARSDLDRLATTIVNEAYDHIQEHFVLVLDDYHFVDDVEDIGYFVNQFIRQMDENCHVVIASRSLLTLPDLPLLVARSQVIGLSFDELAFRANEIQSLVLQNHHITLPDAEAEDLARETEGWITGLLLSAQTMWQGMTDRLRSARVSGVGLYDYLAQQVLDQQSAPVRDFLLRTSPMEEFNAELCEAVLGPATYPDGQNWHSLIHNVLQNNLFVLPVGAEGTWLRYHHLFQEFLQTKLSQEHPDEETRILRKLARVYTDRGEWEKAHDLYQRLGDVVAIANLIENNGSLLRRAGRLKTLAKWINALPSDILASRPAILSLYGSVLKDLGQVEQGLLLQNQAVQHFRTSGDQVGLGRALTQRTVTHRFLGNYEASLADADEALALVAKGDEELCDIRAEALRARGQGLSRLGQLQEAVEWLVQSLLAYRTLNDVERVAMLQLDLGLAYFGTGRYDKASTHYNRALDYWRKTVNVGQQANLLNNLGVLHHLRGDYEQADLLLEEALACAEQSGYIRVKAAALASIGDLYADLDAIDAASAACRQAHEIAQQIDDRFLLLYLGLAEAGLARLKGELGHGQELLDAARQLVRKSSSDFEKGMYHLEAGRLALASGKVLDALDHLEEAANRLNSGDQKVGESHAHLYLALAHHMEQNDEETANHLEHAFRSASELESQHPLVIAARDAKKLLEAVRASPTLGHLADRLLRQVVEFEQELPTLRRRLRRQASAVPFGYPKLHIQALGRTQVTVDGKPVANADWQGQAARDLFFYLLTHPNGLTKEALGSIIWPESSPSQLKLRFKNAIYRLRQALVQEAVLFDEDRYQFNRTVDYEYDVEAFLGGLAQAKAATNLDEQVAALQSAIRTYKGPYLPEVEGEWAWWERERLRQAHVDATVQLAELHLESGRHATALEYCQRAFAEDACLEEAHRLAMRAHAAMGNRAAVVRQFEQCQQALHEEVNVSPSSETMTLYETLVFP